MKNKFLLFIFLFFLCMTPIYASSLTVSVEKNKNKYELVYYEDNIKISYEDAIEKYNIDKLNAIDIDSTTHYFYLGKEITKEEYQEYVPIIENDFCQDKDIKCLKVKDTKDILKIIDEINLNDENITYHLLYDKEDFNKINFDEVKDYYSKLFMTPIDQNIYKFKEYGYRHPIKDYPIYDEEKLIISNFNVKTDKEEMQKVDKFLDKFIPLFKDSSDYEKILGTYIYLNNTTEYQVDMGVTKLRDGVLSPYDVLFTHKTVCIGTSSTFQYIMERMGIESYIVDHAYIDDQTYRTTHTYNVVKLDGKWYIVDINNKNLDGLLLGKNYFYSDNDFIYYDLKLADQDYLSENNNLSVDFDFDYDYLNKVLDSIDKEKIIKEEKGNNTSNYEYILLSSILVLIFAIILIFVKRK